MVVAHHRQHIFSIPENIQILWESFKKIIIQRPFQIDTIVILPDHIHCIWTLPENDVDFLTRWRLIKRYFSIRLPAPLNARGKKKIWQRRFWEHLIKDDNDLSRHMDYNHYNPIKHGYVRRPEEWEYSSYRRFFAQGHCSYFLEKTVLEKIENMNFE